MPDCSLVWIDNLVSKTRRCLPYPSQKDKQPWEPGYMIRSHRDDAHDSS